MAGVIPVSSIDDPRVAAYRWMSDPARIEAEGLIVVEGRLVVPRLLDAAGRAGPWQGAARSVLLSPAAHAAMRECLTACPEVPVYVAPQAVMNQLTGFNIHRGCVALATRPPVPVLTAARAQAARRVIVLEGVNNPDNVGGIFRSAAALGADLVVLGPHCGDPLYRKAMRTSMGAALAVPYCTAEVWPAALALLGAAGLVTAALTPARDAMPLPSWRPVPARVAVVAGAEGTGLSEAALAAADLRLAIPMTDLVDSLNVATAVAVALYHVNEAVN